MISSEILSSGKILNRAAVKLSQVSGILLRMEKHLSETGCDVFLGKQISLLRGRVDENMHLMQKSAHESLDLRLRDLLQTIPGISSTLATARYPKI